MTIGYERVITNNIMKCEYDMIRPMIINQPRHIGTINVVLIQKQYHMEYGVINNGASYCHGINMVTIMTPARIP